MKTNLIKTELTLAQILNHQLNAKDLDNHSPQIKYLNGLFTIIIPFTC